MKNKFTSLLGLLAFFALGAQAQSQRLVLVEAFSQASCGPCAAQNPALNATLAANSSKAVSIKYQTSWPGVDPMNAQNAPEAAARVSYYGVSGVPDRRLDGNQGATVSNTTIDNRYNTPSPFSVDVTHSFNADYTQITIDVTVTASQNVSIPSANALKLHVAMVEKEINFDTPPGTNGEKVFFSVMRKMYPNASGTTLSNSWTSGQVFTQTFNQTVPTYIYDKSQIAIVAFVQEDGTREVHQAGYSIPQPLAIDGAITAIAGIPVISCATTISPSYTLRNAGQNQLTSATIRWQLNNGAITDVPWNGSLATNATQNVTIPNIPVVTGSHVLKIWVANPNGVPDVNPGNDQKQVNVNILGPGVPVPIAEGFQNTAFPASGWTLDNPDGGPTWTRLATAGSNNSTASARMNFYLSPAGEIDDLYMPQANLSGITGPMTLTFDYAYATYQNEEDKLDIQVSTNCGSTWTTVMSYQGASFQTAPPSSSSFVPTSAQWKSEVVDMAQFLGQSQVLVRFRATSAYGNNLFIDNVNLANVASVLNRQQEVLPFELYPNPAANQITVDYSVEQSDIVSLRIINAIGAGVLEQTFGQLSTGTYRQVIDISALPAGVYFVQMNNSEKTLTKKLIINK